MNILLTVKQMYLPLIQLFTVNNNYLSLIESFTVKNNISFEKAFTVNRRFYR